MPSISEFISPSHVPRKYNSFKEFQKLPEIVRNALAHVTKAQDAHEEGNYWPSERDATQYVIDHYDMNQTRSVGELTLIMSRFIDRPVRCRMVRCYVDHGCNMLAAKLAWHEDY